MIAGALAIALSGYAQKSEPIPSDMMGTPGTVIRFVRDTASLIAQQECHCGKRRGEQEVHHPVCPGRISPGNPHKVGRAVHTAFGSASRPRRTQALAPIRG